MTRYAYIYDESDAQGPHVLLCEDCIRNSFEDGQFFGLSPNPTEAYAAVDWAGDLESDGVRCACCGATGDEQAAA